MKEYTTEQLKIIALADQFRAQGEFWSGTPEDAAYQMCANYLLAMFGLTDEDRLAYREARKLGLAPEQITFEQAYATLLTDGLTPEKALYTLKQILEVVRLIDDRDMYQGAVHKALRLLQQGYSVKAVMNLLDRAEKKMLPHDDHAFVPAWLTDKSRNYWRRFWMWVAHWGSNAKYR